MNTRNNIIIWDTEQIVAFAETVCTIQQRIVNTGQGLDSKQPNAQGNVESVLYASFAVIFNVSPAERNGYADIFDQIAYFAAHLAKDHIFPDANKRTTVLTCMSLLRSKGIILDIEDAANPFDNVLYQWVQHIVEGKTGRDVLAEQLRSHARPGRGGGLKH